MATRNTYQDDSISAHTASEDVLGLQELLDQATLVLTQGDVSKARHLVELAALLYEEPRLAPILEGLVLRESQVREEPSATAAARAESGVIGTTRERFRSASAAPTDLWYLGLSRKLGDDDARWLFSGRIF